MIFRRENRGESFQRQISNLRQQPVEQDEEREGRDLEFEYQESGDTSRFSTDQGSSEGLSFSASRVADAESQSQTAAPAYQSQPRWQTPDTSTSVIAANSHWNGTLRSEGGLNVLGRADGELHASGDLFVAEGAEVDAELHAESVIVAGLVRGRIIAGSRLEVLPQGQVTGDVKAPKLVVHEGATITGQLRMQGGESTATDSRQRRSPKAEES
jgi:cytoskeletal protein CcmA (bactofilin family)